MVEIYIRIRYELILSCRAIIKSIVARLSHDFGLPSTLRPHERKVEEISPNQHNARVLRYRCTVQGHRCRKTLMGILSRMNDANGHICDRFMVGHATKVEKSSLPNTAVHPSLLNHRSYCAKWVTSHPSVTIRAQPLLILLSLPSPEK